jgi:hypothetical protein
VWIFAAINFLTRSIYFSYSRESLVGGKVPFLSAVFFLKSATLSISSSTLSG